MLGGFFGGSGPAPATEPTFVSPAELNEFHRKSKELQQKHIAELEALHGRLIEENDGLKSKLKRTEDELRLFKLGHKDDHLKLESLTKEIKGLRGGDLNGGSFAVAILDFEDGFAPSIFHQPDHAGRVAARALRAKIRASLPADLHGAVVNTMIFVFLTRKQTIAPDLIAEGLIRAPKDLELFIASFNSFDPLICFMDTTDPKEITLQRMRALATIFARLSQCCRLVLGRWAFDLELMEMISPSRLKADDSKKPKFDDKIRFVEPFPKTFVSGQFRSRDPKLIDMKGVLRKMPLRRGRGRLGLPQLNTSRGLHQQNPPICLDYYLQPQRCPRELCDFCHSYQLTPGLVQELRLQIAVTPCAMVLQGYPCPHGEECLFAHECPRGLRCTRQGCNFAPHMHPQLPPQPRFQHPPQPYPQQQQQSFSPRSAQTAAPRPASATTETGGGWAAMDEALESLHSSLQGSPRPRAASSLPPTSPKVNAAPPPRRPTFNPRGPGSLAARAAARLAQKLTQPPLVPIPDPAHNPFAAEFGDQVGSAQGHGQGHVGGGQDGVLLDSELEAMTDEQFEAYRLELEQREAEMMQAELEGEADGADGGSGVPDGVAGATRANKAQSVLFGDGGRKAQDRLAGRKGGGVVHPRTALSATVQHTTRTIMSTTCEDDANEWQRLIERQDTFVASLLNEKLRLTEANRQLLAAKSSSLPQIDNSQQLKELSDYSESLEAEIERCKTELAEREQKAQQAAQEASRDAAHQAQQISALQTRILERERAGPPAASASAQTNGTRPSKSGSGAPYILVLIDGSCAPFADNLVKQGQTGGAQAAAQVRWEVEKDLRAFDVTLDVDEGGDEPAEVMTYVWYNKAALVTSFCREGVLASGATWDSFALAFNSSPNVNLVDVGATPVETKVAAMLKVHTATRSLKRIYLVGLHPTSLLAALPGLAESQNTPLSRRAKEKIVCVNHRESDSDRAELSRFGWRVSVMSRFFTSSAGLGNDWGWGFDGDENHTGQSENVSSDESEKYGYAPGSTSNGKSISGSGKWQQQSSTSKAARAEKRAGNARKIDPNKGFLQQGRR